jgi:hypothetical protein
MDLQEADELCSLFKVYMIYVEASSCCNENFWHEYPIRIGNNRICVILLQSHQNGNDLQITTNMPLICLVVHTAENFLHIFLCFLFVDDTDN